MPLVGTRSLATLAAAAPAVTVDGSESWNLPGAEILQLMYEIDDGAMTALIPPALHPTIPPTIVLVVTRVPESPVGPFTLAEARVGARSGARPRGLVVRAFCDSTEAIATLGKRWGYPLVKADVTLEKRYDQIRGRVTAGGSCVLDLALVNPEPISGNDLQYLATLNLARITRDGKETVRLIQVDPDYVFRSSDRGKPQLTTFDAAAWALEGAKPVFAVSASYAVADIKMPELRYLVDPEKAPVAAVERI
jgi:Acetoacetate decarboxylase (ADC)